MVSDILEREAQVRLCQFLDLFKQYGAPIPKDRTHECVGMYQLSGFSRKVLLRLLWLEYLKEVGNVVSLTEKGLNLLDLPPDQQYRKVRRDWRYFVRTKCCDTCGEEKGKSLIYFRGKFLCEKCLNPDAEKPDYSVYRQYSVFDTVNPY